MIKSILPFVYRKMVYMLKYNQFINTGLYRTSDADFIKELINNGSVDNGGYFSLSKEFDSGGMDDYGQYTIVFDRNLLESKNELIEVEYTPEFFASNPDVAMKVLGFTEESYDEEAMGEDWESYINTYENEQEVLVKSPMVYTPGMFKSVHYNGDNPDEELLGIL